MSAQPSFRDRFIAWWEGVPVVPPPADSESEEIADPPREPEADEDAAAANGGGPSALQAFRERFKAWWEGTEPPPAEAEAPDPPADDAAPAAPQDDPPADDAPDEPARRSEDWTPERIKIAERIWGAGFVTPGGAEYVLKLVKPFGLQPEMNFLDLGAGMGGPARIFSEVFGIWATAMEASEKLAAHGMEESTMAGMAKKAPVYAYDPESVELRKHMFDCIFSKEAFFTVVNKGRLFKTIEKALKRGGQLLITDYVLAGTGEPGPEAKDWIAKEPVPPELWSVEQIRDCLAGLDLDIRIEDDITEEMRGLILQGWDQALANLKPGHLGPGLREALVDEAEKWTRRMAVLESGEVRVYRFHALKP